MICEDVRMMRVDVRMGRCEEVKMICADVKIWNLCRCKDEKVIYAYAKT